jgi:hypothetical protein
MDPIFRLADEQMRALSIDLMVQLEKGTAMRPVLWLLAKAREKASKAFVMFIDADPADVKLIQQLQSEVKLYDDMILSCRELLALGKEADLAIRESDRQALDEIVSEMTDEERRLNQLEPRGQD